MPYIPDVFDYDVQTTNAEAVNWLVSGAANIRFGDNPAYTVDDFIAFYPQFGPSGPVDAPVWPIPKAVLTAYIALASACLAQPRWQDHWSFGMALYVAHFATLYLQAMAAVGSPAAVIAEAGMERGIQVSKSAGDLSVSYQAIVSGWESWGQWNLTTFSQQLMSFARIIGMGGMYIW